VPTAAGSREANPGTHTALWCLFRPAGKAVEQSQLTDYEMNGALAIALKTKANLSVGVDVTHAHQTTDEQRQAFERAITQQEFRIIGGDPSIDEVGGNEPVLPAI
jgi:hypothetical protein